MSGRAVIIPAVMAVVLLVTVVHAQISSDRPATGPATGVIEHCLHAAGYTTTETRDMDLPPGAEPNGLLMGLDVKEGPNAADVIDVQNRAGEGVALIRRPDHGGVQLRPSMTSTDLAQRHLRACVR